MHVSQLSDKFIKDPSEVVKVSQRVMVTVTEVDLPRKRIALSMKAVPVIGPSTTGQRTSPSAPKPSGGFNRPAQPAKPQAVDWFTEAMNRNKGEIAVLFRNHIWGREGRMVGSHHKRPPHPDPLPQGGEGDGSRR